MLPPDLAQTPAFEGNRQSEPSLGTPRGRGDKNKNKNFLKQNWGNLEDDDDEADDVVVVVVGLVVRLEGQR